MSTNYQRGSAFENFIKKKLEQQGYYVGRMAGSHTVCDLVAIGKDEVLMIQCKSSSVEEIPDLKTLLKDFETKRVKKMFAGRWMDFPEVVESNVLKLAKLKVPHNTYKIILWKGSKSKTYYELHFNGDWRIVHKSLRKVFKERENGGKCNG